MSEARVETESGTLNYWTMTDRRMILVLDGSWRYYFVTTILLLPLLGFAGMGLLEAISGRSPHPWIFLGLGFGCFFVACFICWLQRGLWRSIQVLDGFLKCRSLWLGRDVTYSIDAISNVDSRFTRDVGRLIISLKDGKTLTIDSGNYAYADEFAEDLEILLRKKQRG